MKLFDTDLEAIRTFFLDPQNKQRVHMVLFQAVADVTELSAKDTDAVLERLDTLLEINPEVTKRDDPAR